MVFIRYAGEPPRRILYTRTSDSRQTFIRPVKLSLPNSDNSVAATLQNDGGSFIVDNYSSTARHVLSLAVSSDNTSGEWVRVYDFENAGENTSRRFSYPTVLRDRQGNYHVTWTHDRTFIKHHEMLSSTSRGAFLISFVWFTRQLDVIIGTRIVTN